MEAFEAQNSTERSGADLRRTAEEIRKAISTNLSRLLHRDGLSEDHSRVVELRQEYDIVSRTLRELDGEESLVRAA